MSLASTSHLSLCSSPTLPRTALTKQTQLLCSQTKLLSSKNWSCLSTSPCFLNTQLVKLSIFVIKASETESQTSKPAAESGNEEGGEEAFEEYEVEVVQPYGLKFAKGRDGGTYIDAIAAGGSADKTGKFSVGDKVLATSAVFGDEIWAAAEYGRTMYTIRQRVGPLLMRMQKRNGKIDNSGELTEKEIIRAERNSGVISNKVREIQMQNYLKKKEQKARRESDLREGLQLDLILHSLLVIQAGLSALEDALKAGFEDFKRIRTDPDLANVRASEEFDPLLKRFDESFINENAINAIKSLFGIFNKK